MYDHLWSIDILCYSTKESDHVFMRQVLACKEMVGCKGARQSSVAAQTAWRWSPPQLQAVDIHSREIGPKMAIESTQTNLATCHGITPFLPISTWISSGFVSLSWCLSASQFVISQTWGSRQMISPAASIRRSSSAMVPTAMRCALGSRETITQYQYDSSQILLDSTLGYLHLFTVRPDALD